MKRTIVFFFLVEFITFFGRAQETGQEFSESHQLDSLNQLTSELYHDTIRADALIKISLILYISNFDTLLALSKQAEEMAKKNLTEEISSQEKKTFLRIQSEATSNIAYYFQETGDLDEALSNYRICLGIDKNQGNYEGISASLNNIGMIYYYQGQVVTALDYFLLSLRIDENIADPSELGPTLNNLGYIYEHQGDTTNALIYYNRALSSFKLAQDELSQAAILINIGSVLRHQNEQKAIEKFTLALEICNKFDYVGGKASTLLNLGNVYFENGDYDLAFEYLNEALPLFEQTGDRAGLSVCYVNLGKIFRIRRNYSEAAHLGERGLEVSIEIGNVYNQKAAYELLSEVYQSTHEFEKSLIFYQHFIQMRDSLLNTETKQKAFQKKLEYEYDKEQALSELSHKKEMALSEQEKKNQYTVLFFSISLLILLIVFTFIISARLKKTRNQKLLIEEKNRENELLLGEIHHRVKNNLQVISSLLSLQEKSLTDESAKNAILESKERVKSMGLIHKMLYQQDNFSGIQIKEYVQELAEGLFATFGLSGTTSALKLEIDDLIMDVDTAIPLGLILNELIVNTLKHGLSDKEKIALLITIQLKNGLEVEIHDNGNGKKAEIENSTSFGSKLVRSLVRQLNGKMHIDDVKGLHYTLEIQDYKLV